MPFSKIGQRYQLYHGVVVENTTTKNQRWFHIYCPELLPAIENDVTKEEVIDEIDILNTLTNQHERIKVRVSTTIYAEYRGVDTNRSVPTLWRGMQVMVFNYANSDKYYWFPLERDDNRRRREHIRWSVADQDITNKNLDNDNTYFLEIDTKYRKHVWLHLSNSDGEAYKYDFKIDAETHVVELYDTPTDPSKKSNTFRIDSDIPRISVQNASGTGIILNDVNLEVTVPGDFIMNVGKDVRINVKQNWFIKILGDLRDIIIGKRKTTQQGNWERTIIGTQIHNMTGARTTNLFDTDTRTVKNLDKTVVGSKARTVLGDFADTTKNRHLKTVGEDYVVSSKRYQQFAEIGKVHFVSFGSTLTLVIPSPIGQATCQLIKIQ